MFKDFDINAAVLARPTLFNNETSWNSFLEVEPGEMLWFRCQLEATVKLIISLKGDSKI